MRSARLSLTFGALADPTRRAILTRLADGDATVNELAEPFAISKPAISRHLKVLEHADSVRIEARAGGRWELTMVPRGGGERFTIGYEILELVEPELLVMRSDPMPGHAEGTVVRVELHDHGPKTRVTLTDGPFPAGRGHAEA